MKRLLFSLFMWVSLSGYGQSFSIMTYNIRFDNPDDGFNQWPLRREKLISLLEKYDPDIFGVQEALVNQLKDIESGLDGYEYIGVGRDDGKEKGEFSAIFYKKSKFSIVRSNTFWLSETPTVPGSKSWDAAITRVATWALFRDNKSRKKFFVINTHYDHIGKTARANSSKLLVAKAREVARKKPVIITGDFNCTRDEEPYHTLMNQNKVKLFDPAPSNPPGTFCNFAVGSMICRPIDYIFHSKHWKASNYQVISDNDGGNYPSDHLPVEVDVSLKK